MAYPRITTLGWYNSYPNMNIDLKAQQRGREQTRTYLMPYSSKHNFSSKWQLVQETFVNPWSAKKKNASENVVCWSRLLQIIA